MELDNWNTQLRKGLLEFCILKILSGDEKYGYQIVQELKKVESLVISEGTIYPILNRLKKEKMVSLDWKDSTEGPPRKYYVLTTYGRKVLEEMTRRWQRISGSISDLMKGNNKRRGE